MFDPQLYLTRLGIDALCRPSAEFLIKLHRAHVSEIAYNNIDILLGIPYDLSMEALFDKVIRRRRGGFCYELAPLFAKLLQHLGFEAKLVSARLMQRDGQLGPEFDHGVVVVQLEERWLADVGNSRFFLSPLRLDETGWQQYGSRCFRVQHEHESIAVLERGLEGDRLQYIFTMRERDPSEFEPMCRQKWTSPDSKFVRGLVIGRGLGENRIALNRDRLVTFECSEMRVEAVRGYDDLRAKTLELFGPQLDCDSFLGALIQPAILDALTL